MAEPTESEAMGEAAEPVSAPASPEPRPARQPQEFHERPPRREFPQAAIARALEEVQQIVESLEQALDQMEEVQKLVQTAEQQKIGDEREIESLRRALRRIQPPRHHRDEPKEPPSESFRSEQ